MYTVGPWRGYESELWHQRLPSQWSYVTLPGMPHPPPKVINDPESYCNYRRLIVGLAKNTCKGLKFLSRRYWSVSLYVEKISKLIIALMIILIKSSSYSFLFYLALFLVTYIEWTEGTPWKKLFDIPIPSWDVTYQSLPGQEKFIYDVIIPAQGEFGKWHPGWGREYQKAFFYDASLPGALLRSNGNRKSQRILVF